MFRELMAGFHSTLSDEYFLTLVKIEMSAFVLDKLNRNTWTQVEAALNEMFRRQGCYAYGALCSYDQNPQDIIDQGKIGAHIEFQPTRFHSKVKYYCTIEPKINWDRDVLATLSEQEKMNAVTTALFFYKKVDHA